MDQIGNFSSLKIGGDETEKCIEAMINLQNITENDFFLVITLSYSFNNKSCFVFSKLSLKTFIHTIPL